MTGAVSLFLAVTDAAEEGKRIIGGMLVVGLVFVGVILLGETANWLIRRRNRYR